MEKIPKVFLSDVDSNVTILDSKALILNTNSFTLLGSYVYRVGKGILDNITRFQTFRPALVELTHEGSKEIACQK